MLVDQALHAWDVEASTPYSCQSDDAALMECVIVEVANENVAEV